MNDLYEDDETWNMFMRHYYWVLLLLIILAFLLIGLLLWYIRHCRREPRYDYTSLADESYLQERLEMDRKLARDSDRDMATICCQYYLRGSNRYVFLQHLPDMGSRVGKNWYLVRDTTTKTERLLTMTPLPESCPLRLSHSQGNIKQALRDLFLAISHPYICPVLDIDRKSVMDQEYVIAVLPFNEEGTLKDFIYQSHCQDDWKDKYHYHGYGLSASQIQRLGAQILEALLFLKDQKFPAYLHLHSGNVIVQNGVARIAGLENTLFGYSSRFLTLVPKKLLDNKEAIEVVSFGHLIFEMAAGYELTGNHPSEKNYKDVEHSPQVVDVLRFVFEQGRYRYPSLRQIANLEFFRHIDLRELRSLMPVPSIKAKLNSAALLLLKDVKRSQRSKRHGKSSQSVSSLESDPTTHSRRSKSSSSSSKRKSQSKGIAESNEPKVIPSEPPLDPGHLLRTLPFSNFEASRPSDDGRVSHSDTDDHKEYLEKAEAILQRGRMDRIMQSPVLAATYRSMTAGSKPDDSSDGMVSHSTVDDHKEYLDKLEAVLQRGRMDRIMQSPVLAATYGSMTAGSRLADSSDGTVSHSAVDDHKEYLEKAEAALQRGRMDRIMQRPALVAAYGSMTAGSRPDDTSDVTVSHSAVDDHKEYLDKAEALLQRGRMDRMMQSPVLAATYRSMMAGSKPDDSSA